MPYKVSLYRGRDGHKCIFWPQFPFFLPGGLFFPTFYPISLTLWFSLRFWQCRQFQCHCTCGWKPYFRNNRGCKRTAFSEANSSVHLIYSTRKTASSAKHCLLELVWRWSTAWRGPGPASPWHIPHCLLLCVTLWAVAHQAPLSMGFSRIFPTQGLNAGLLCYRQILHLLSHQGSLLHRLWKWN